MRPLSRKRSLRVAAAGLSLAMAAAFAPGVFPTIEPEVAHAAPATAAAQDQIIDADMIASGRVTKAANLTDAHGVGFGLISGHVYLASPNGNPGAAYDNGNVKLDGITVYAQFRDKDGSYSPIFSAKTHTLPNVVGGNGGKGTFAFGTGDKGITWTDKFGKEHSWSARTDQKHRIWVEPYTNERGNRVEMFRQANGWTPGSFNGVVEGPMGSFVAADGNMQLMAAFLREVPPNHKESWMAAKGDKLVEDPKGPISEPGAQLKVSNTLSGQVWLETGGAPDWGFPATGPKRDSVTQDPAADGYTVYASTLTKDGAAANEALHAKYKNDPDKLSEETKKMLEDHPEYILKTVYGKTDPEGNYSLRFGDYTDKSQTREDFLNPNHVFVWVENKDGIVQNGYTGFHTPIFQRFNGGGNFKPADAVPAENQTVSSRVEDLNTPRYGKPLNNIYNVRHALMPYAPVSITADYNTTDKPAAPGVTVTPEFSGDLSPLPSKIEWRDKNGKVLKTCELDQSKSAKAQVAACTFDIPEDAQKGDVYNVVVVSGNNDVAAWSVLVTDKASDEFDPAYEDKLVVPGEETKSTPTFTDKDGKDAKAPEGSKFTIGEDFKAPEGYEVKIDENTGEITVTFPDKSKLNKDTVEEFEVPVTVTYPDGSKDDTTAKFKLDTDGDGKPDTEDEDDDNDGIPDGEDDNPKVPNQNTVYEPAYEDKLVVPGKETKSTPTFTDKDGKDAKAPEGSKFTIGEDFTAPDGYEVKIDENTGEITVTFPDKSKLNKDTVEEFDVPVTVTYPDGSTDKTDANFKLDTDGDGKPDTEDEDDDNDGIPDGEDDNPKVPNQNTVYEPAYEGKLVVPGEETKSNPTFTDKDGKDAKAPEGSKFSIPEDFKAPEGYVVEIDENTGEITVTFPDKSKLNKDTVEEFDVPVTVTYPDGSTDKTDANFKLDTDNDGKPDTEDGDDDGDGIPDGEDDNPKVPNQNTVYEPEYEDGSGKPGDNVTIDEPGFKDKDGKDTKAPEGTKFTPGEGAPEGVKVDENTGEITVPIPEDAKPGEKITVPVDVTYPDGTKDTAEVTVTVEDPGAPEVPDTKQADELEPKYKDGFGQPGTKAPVDEPTFTDKDGNKVTVPEGTKFTTDKDGVEIAEDGSLKVQIPADAKPGDKITVPVTVTYPDGSTDTVDVIVNVTDPDSKPEWGDGEGEPGDEVTVPNEGGDVPEGSTPEVDGPGKAEIDEDGNLIVDIDEDAKPGDEIVIVVKDPEGNTIDESTVTVTEPSTPAEKDADKYEPEYEDGSGKPGDNVTIDEPGFKDKDGKDTKTPEGTKFTPGDDAPDGVKVDENTGEITVPIPEDAKPGDKITVPVDVTYPDGSKDTAEVTVTVEKPDAPAEKPDWKDDSGKPGDTVEIPNTGGKVEDGTTVETEGPGKAEIDEDGKITVDIDDDAKPGDKIVVIVKDKDGNEIDRVVVEVEKPDAPAEKPDWKDDSGKPGDTVEIPNTGGKVEDGTTVETEGPGKAEIDKDGNIRVEIDKNAKPGDKIKVVVKDKDGKVIDEITVTVKDPKKTDAENYQPKWNDSTIKPGDTITLPNIGDKLPDGTTLEIKGKDLPNGWGVQIDKTGAIKVTAPSWAKPGDKVKIPVHITYPDGSTEVVYFTVTVTGDTDNGGSNDKGAPLPRTGVEVGAALAAATALIAGGIALIARSRRRNN